MHGNDDGCNLESLTSTPDAWSFQTKGRQSSTSKIRQRTQLVSALDPRQIGR